jgi:hypothetical protein
MSRTRDNAISPLAPRSKFYQGPFGRVCTDLPAWTSPGVNGEVALSKHFEKIAREEMVEAVGLSPTQIATDQAKIDELEAKFSSDIPAGYTYFGQFIDHDVTFDPASQLMRSNDPSGLLNHRTPRLDLDNIYGSGPGASPHLYDNATLAHGGRAAKFLIENVIDRSDPDNPVMTELPDLARNSHGRALIADPRNDENSMVSQIQLAFLLAHNNLVQRADDAGDSAPFQTAQKTLRWLYQHIVWNDFVVRIANDAIWKKALKFKDGSWSLGL